MGFVPESPVRTRLAGGGKGLRTIGPLASSVINERQIEFSEMHRGEFGGGLFAPDLPEPTAQQGDDFLLNLRIVQQTQERPFESLVLLRLLDLVFSFGSILHGSIMPQGSSAERPSVDVKNPSEWHFSPPWSFSVGLFFGHRRIPPQCGWRSDLGPRRTQ
jgi:hypothetical protein